MAATFDQCGADTRMQQEDVQQLALMGKSPGQASASERGEPDRIAAVHGLHSGAPPAGNDTVGLHQALAEAEGHVGYWEEVRSRSSRLPL